MANIVYIQTLLFTKRMPFTHDIYRYRVELIFGRHVVSLVFCGMNGSDHGCRLGVDPQNGSLEEYGEGLIPILIAWLCCLCIYPISLDLYG